MPRAARPQQSQSQGPSQSQRTRAGRNRVQDDEGDDEETPNEDQMVQDDEDEDEGNSELTRKAHDLVRLALFMEQKRTPLRRDEISKKILSSNPRAFNLVFENAQSKLRSTFGMEMVELPSRAGLDQGTAADDELNEARNATGIKKKASAVGSKTYILRSVLDPVLIEHAAQTDDKILEAEAEDQAIFFPLQNPDDDDDDDENTKYYGSIISWTRTDQLGPTGILYVVLALILVGGRVLGDGELRAYLKALHLPNNKESLQPVHLDATSTTRTLDVDTYLSTLLKQNYLDREQVGGEGLGKKTKKGAGSKRLRSQADDREEGRSWEWRWGSRAFCEVGEEAIGQFIAEFMVGFNDDDEADAGGRHQEAALAKMLKGIEKAAGGTLQELRA